MPALTRPRTARRHDQPIEDRGVALEAEIPRLQGEIDFLRIQQLSQAEIVSAAEELSERWYDLPQGERRGIVQAIVKRVTVGKGEIEFSLTCLPAGPPPLPPLPK